MQTKIRWDDTAGQWAATLNDGTGTTIRSPSKTELEAFLDSLENSPHARRREWIETGAVIAAVVLILVAAPLAAWLLTP